MGAFISNCHVYTDSLDAVRAELVGLVKIDAHAAKSGSRWVSVYPDESDSLARIAKHLSLRLSTAAIEMIVHDSDVLYYTLYEHGKKTDEYDSQPDYFNDTGKPVSAAKRARLAGNTELLLKYAPAGTTAEAVRHMLGMRPTFAEHQLLAFGALMGIDEDCVVRCSRYMDDEDLEADAVSVIMVQPEATPEYLTRKLIKQLDEHTFMTAVAEELILRGADVNALYNPAGYNLLMHCISPHPNVAAVELLIKHGADVNHRLPAPERMLEFEGRSMQADGGTTPLILAAETFNSTTADPTVVMRLLIDAGADVHARTDHGRTALSVARDLGDETRKLYCHPSKLEELRRQRKAVSEARAALLLAAGAMV